VRSRTGRGIGIAAGVGSLDGRPGVADHNQATAIVAHNTVEDNTDRGLELPAGGAGLANANTLTVWVAHDTVCHTAGADIVAEGGFSSNLLYPLPNQGTGNVLTGRLFENTATVVVQPGAQNRTPENTATVTQFHNDPCL